MPCGKTLEKVQPKIGKRAAAERKMDKETVTYQKLNNSTK
jgi:hypothetical protein